MDMATGAGISLNSRKAKLTLKLSDDGGASIVRNAAVSHLKYYQALSASVPQSPVSPELSSFNKVSRSFDLS